MPNKTFVCDPRAIMCYSWEEAPRSFAAAADACALKGGELVQYSDGASQYFVER